MRIYCFVTHYEMATFQLKIRYTQSENIEIT